MRNRILASSSAQLNGGVRSRHIPLGADAGGIDLLHKGNAAFLSQTHARAAAHGDAGLLQPGKPFPDPGYQLSRLGDDLAEMALILGEEQLPPIIQDNNLERRAPNIQTDSQIPSSMYSPGFHLSVNSIYLYSSESGLCQPDNSVFPDRTHQKPPLRVSKRTAGLNPSPGKY